MPFFEQNCGRTVCEIVNAGACEEENDDFAVLLFDEKLHKLLQFLLRLAHEIVVGECPGNGLCGRCRGRLALPLSRLARDLHVDLNRVAEPGLGQRAHLGGLRGGEKACATLLREAPDNAVSCVRVCVSDPADDVQRKRKRISKEKMTLLAFARTPYLATCLPRPAPTPPTPLC